MGQNYHLVHHLWPSVPWYNYERAYHATKPILDAKGSHQSLGILATTKDLFGFLYDVVLGIRFHPKSESDDRALATAAREFNSTAEEILANESSEPKVIQL
jgi:beta-carotene hydroxylase